MNEDDDVSSLSRRPTIVITGASDGIGAAAARSLAADNDVVIVGRNPEKTKAVASEISAPYFIADFARLDDVKQLAARLNTEFERIDVLANNAGMLAGKRERTQDGHELTFQVNHLAPFLLTMLLEKRLVQSNARVINTSSAAHQMAKINLAKIDQPTWTWRAYANSKLANVLFTNELHRRWNARGITTASFHPGVIVSGFARDNKFARMFYKGPLGARMQTPVEGAATLTWLATADTSQWQSGGYYFNLKQQTLRGQATDTKLAEDLWKLSDDLLREMRS